MVVTVGCKIIPYRKKLFAEVFVWNLLKSRQIPQKNVLILSTKISALPHPHPKIYTFRGKVRKKIPSLTEL